MVTTTQLTTELNAPLDETGTKLVHAARQLAGASSPAQRADAVNAALELAAPHAERVVCLFAPSWPTATLNIEDITAEALFEIAALFQTAPRTSASRIMAWLSAKLMDTVYARFVDAKFEARLERAFVHTQDAAVATDSLTTESSNDTDDASSGLDDGEEILGTADSVSHAHRLQEVLGRLMATDARLLSLRASGASFSTIGRLIGASATTARRHHERALTAARRVAADLYTHAA